jgi:hypothetical protein
MARANPHTHSPSLDLGLCDKINLESLPSGRDQARRIPVHQDRWLAPMVHQHLETVLRQPVLLDYPTEIVRELLE